MVEYSQLRALSKRLGNMSSSALSDTRERLCDELAARVIRSAVKLTPAKSGHLKGNYRASAVYSTGNGSTITVFNAVKYAPYVEEGHRTRGGNGFVKGRHMLKNATEQVDRQAPKIIEKELKSEIERLMK